MSEKPVSHLGKDWIGLIIAVVVTLGWFHSLNIFAANIPKIARHLDILFVTQFRLSIEFIVIFDKKTELVKKIKSFQLVFFASSRLHNTFRYLEKQFGIVVIQYNVTCFVSEIFCFGNFPVFIVICHSHNANTLR